MRRQPPLAERDLGALENGANGDRELALALVAVQEAPWRRQRTDSSASRAALFERRKRRGRGVGHLDDEDLVRLNRAVTLFWG